jgi:hypothetical protein
LRRSFVAREFLSINLRDMTPSLKKYELKSRVSVTIQNLLPGAAEVSIPDLLSNYTRI